MSRSLRDEEADALDDTDWLVRREGWEACLEAIVLRSESGGKDSEEKSKHTEQGQSE